MDVATGDESGDRYRQAESKLNTTSHYPSYLSPSLPCSTGQHEQPNPPHPTCQSTTTDSRQLSPLARVLQKCIQVGDSGGNHSKRPWRNVRKYYAQRRLELQHRQARAKDDAVRTYRARVIKEQNSIARPTPPQPLRPRVTFSTATTMELAFRQDQPVKTLLGNEGAALTAREAAFIMAD